MCWLGCKDALSYLLFPKIYWHARVNSSVSAFLFIVIIYNSFGFTPLFDGFPSCSKIWCCHINSMSWTWVYCSRNNWCCTSLCWATPKEEPWCCNFHDTGIDYVLQWYSSHLSCLCGADVLPNSILMFWFWWLRLGLLVQFTWIPWNSSKIIPDLAIELFESQSFLLSDLVSKQALIVISCWINICEQIDQKSI